MNVVDPIRDPQKIREIKQKLRATNSRDYLLFTMGINLALRASDLLALKVGDLFDKGDNVVRYLIL
jgi:integrase